MKTSEKIKTIISEETKNANRLNYIYSVQNTVKKLKIILNDIPQIHHRKIIDFTGLALHIALWDTYEPSMRDYERWELLYNKIVSRTIIPVIELNTTNETTKRGETTYSNS